MRVRAVTTRLSPEPDDVVDADLVDDEAEAHDDEPATDANPLHATRA